MTAESVAPRPVTTIPGGGGVGPVPVEPVDLDGYLPAYANPGAVIRDGARVVLSELPRTCGLCGCQWRGPEPCWNCGPVRWDVCPWHPESPEAVARRAAEGGAR